MDSSDQLWQFFRNVLQQLPSMLTFVGGIIFCLARAKRYPRVSLIAAFSLFYLLLHGIVFAGVYTWVPTWFMAGRPRSDSQTFMMVLRLIYNISLAIGLGLLVASIFMRRGPTEVRA